MLRTDMVKVTSYLSGLIFLLILPLNALDTLIIGLYGEGALNFSQVYTWLSRIFVIFVFASFTVRFLDNVKVDQNLFYESMVSLLSLTIMFLNVFYYSEMTSYLGDNLVKGFDYNFPIVFFSLVSFFCGCYFEVKLVKKISTFFLVIFVFLILTNLNSNFLLDLMAVDELYRGMYLRWSDGLVFLAIILIATTDKKYGAVLFFLICYFVMALYSRTALVFFLFTALVVFKRNKSKLISLPSILILAPVMLMLITIVYFSVTDYGEVLSRYIEALTGEATSAKNRSFLAEFGVRDISNYWFFGNYGGQTLENVDQYGARWGAYIHDIRSYYRQFGLIVFLIVICNLFFTTRELWLSWKKKNLNEDDVFFLMIGVFIVLSAIFSRSYIYYQLFFLFGLTINRRYGIIKNECFTY